jgi:ABC-type nitrate/sulfonate/bicarbonate transport system substrate-binding protein
MAANLKAAHLDGYCVGEPWNSLAVLAKTGWIASTSAELRPGHPEKVLLVSRDFAEKRASEHASLIAALLEACRFCAAPENAHLLAKTLSRPEYVNSPVAWPSRPSSPGVAGEPKQVPPPVFSGDGVNAPSQDKAAAILEQMQAAGLRTELDSRLVELGQSTFRADLFQRGVQQLESFNYETQIAHTSLAALR